MSRATLQFDTLEAREVPARIVPWSRVETVVIVDDPTNPLRVETRSVESTVSIASMNPRETHVVPAGPRTAVITSPSPNFTLPPQSVGTVPLSPDNLGFHAVKVR